MSDENPMNDVPEEEPIVQFVPPEPVPEPYEWYKALRGDEVIGEGPTPVPDDIRAQAMEIRWSNPSKDKNFSPDSEPVTPEQIQALEGSVTYTPPEKLPESPNMPRVEPEAPTE